MVADAGIAPPSSIGKASAAAPARAMKTRMDNLIDPKSPSYLSRPKNAPISGGILAPIRDAAAVLIQVSCSRRAGAMRHEIRLETEDD